MLCCLGQREKRTIQTVISAKLKSWQLRIKFTSLNIKYIVFVLPLIEKENPLPLIKQPKVIASIR